MSLGLVLCFYLSFVLFRGVGLESCCFFLGLVEACAGKSGLCPRAPSHLNMRQKIELGALDF